MREKKKLINILSPKRDVFTLVHSYTPRFNPVMFEQTNNFLAESSALQWRVGRILIIAVSIFLRVINLSVQISSRVA